MFSTLRQTLTNVFSRSTPANGWDVPAPIAKEIKTLAREVDSWRTSGAGVPEDKLEKFLGLLLEDGLDREQFFALRKQVLQNGYGDRDAFMAVRDSLSTRKLMLADDAMDLPMGEMYCRADVAAFLVMMKSEPARPVSHVQRPALA